MKPKIVSRDEWTKARVALLAKEKALTRQKDALAAERRELPWVKIEKAYAFDGPQGKETLADLFAGRNQLAVYHFMLGPDWSEGCPSCSMLADQWDGVRVHLEQRDVTFVAVSRAPLKTIEAFKRRMGWTFKWVSSHGSDFNPDFQVSFKPEDVAKGRLFYNYETNAFPAEEAPGMSIFAKDASGALYHTYSTYARGLDVFLNVYNVLDLTPKGRDEAGLRYGMEWVRHHDRYETAAR
jgi:predicted dithiol-disulfide oxidoreductase (DUF899 family)